MDKVQVKALLDKIEKYIPVSVIEKELKMPVNTLQKVLSETEKKKRNLPVKWVKPLTEWVNFKKWITIQYLKQKEETTNQPSKDAILVAETSKRNLSKVLNRDNEPAENTTRFFLKYGAFTHEEAKKLKK